MKRFIKTISLFLCTNLLFWIKRGPFHYSSEIKHRSEQSTWPTDSAKKKFGPRGRNKIVEENWIANGEKNQRYFNDLVKLWDGMIDELIVETFTYNMLTGTTQYHFFPWLKKFEIFECNEVMDSSRGSNTPSTIALQREQHYSLHKLWMKCIELTF